MKANIYKLSTERQRPFRVRNLSEQRETLENSLIQLVLMDLNLNLTHEEITRSIVVHSFSSVVCLCQTTLSDQNKRCRRVMARYGFQVAEATAVTGNHYSTGARFDLLLSPFLFLRSCRRLWIHDTEHRTISENNGTRKWNKTMECFSKSRLLSSDRAAARVDAQCKFQRFEQLRERTLWNDTFDWSTDHSKRLVTTRCCVRLAVL